MATHRERILAMSIGETLPGGAKQSKPSARPGAERLARAAKRAAGNTLPGGANPNPNMGQAPVPERAAHRTFQRMVTGSPAARRSARAAIERLTRAGGPAGGLAYSQGD